jgi:hypothetical protein
MTYLNATSVVVRAQSKSAPAVAASSKSATVVAETDAVLRETSEIRDLSILRPVQSGAQSRAEIERMIIKNLNEETTPAELRASELTLKKLGLVPADFALRSFLIKLLTEQVAGYYDPKTRHFYLADWIDLDGQKPVMAHELTHALQDQHFNLRRFEKWPKGDSDAELAAQSLVEGDATLTMSMYIARNPLRALAFIKSLGAGSAKTEEIDRAPRALRESLLFPYQQGTQWVTQVYKRDGWAGVSKAFTELPQSTEQILHVEKYYAHKTPVKINLPDISASLGKSWKRIDYDVNGEWSYYLILDEYLKAEAESKRATAGWAGDRYAVYEGARPSEILITQLSEWDTARDALEFFDAYAKRTTRRYKVSPLAQNAQKTSEELTWRTSEGTVLIERRASRVLIIEGLPDKIDVQEVKKRLWPR